MLLQHCKPANEKEFWDQVSKNLPGIRSTVEVEPIDPNKKDFLIRKYYSTKLAFAQKMQSEGTPNPETCDKAKFEKNELIFKTRFEDVFLAETRHMLDTVGFATTVWARQNEQTMQMCLQFEKILEAVQQGASLDDFIS